MLKLIWRNWFRQKDRFVLLLAGILIISSGLGVLASLSETNRGTVENVVEKRWYTSYDILVRPPGSQSITEENGLIEPNTLSGIDGGIGMEQYKKILDIPGVDIAAPLAVLGYSGLDMNLQGLDDFREKGIYRATIKQEFHDGAKNQARSHSFYFLRGPWVPPVDSQSGYVSDYGVIDYRGDINVGQYALLVGIDPIQEARLVGLDKAMLSWDNTHYFSSADKPLKVNNEYSNFTEIPVIINRQSFVDEKVTILFERLDLPFDNADSAANTMKTVKENGGGSYLDSIESFDAPRTITYDEQEIFKLLIESFTGINPYNGKKESNYTATAERVQNILGIKPSSLQFQSAENLFAEKWPFTYKVKSYALEDKQWEKHLMNAYRPLNCYPTTYDDVIRLNYNVLGFFDPNKLTITKDPLAELPLETYRPAHARLVLDEDGNPVNPVVTLKPTDNPIGLLTNPPAILTTLDAAATIAGPTPISAIRVKVAGVGHFSEENKMKVEQVAKEIERVTGLATNVTFGSSPQTVLLEVPASGNQPALGWVEQIWIKLGESFAIFREVKMGFSGIILCIVITAVIYVFIHNLLALQERKREFAILLAIGWPLGKLKIMLLLESLIIGSFAALIAWGIQGLVSLFGKAPVSWLRLAGVGIAVFLIYVLGTIFSTFWLRNIKPYEAAQQGEIAASPHRLVKGMGIFTLALHHLSGKWKRHFLSAVAMTVPTTLLFFFMFVTIRLEGMLYTTWLGQYVLMEVGYVHYFAIVVAFLVSIFISTEIMWQNVVERKEEILTLKALGWKNRSIRSLLLTEGMLFGLVSGLIGIFMGGSLIWLVYVEFPLHELWLAIPIIMVTITSGLLGAMIPARSAVRMHPVEGMRERYHANPAYGKRKLAWAATIMVVSIFGLATAITYHKPAIDSTNLAASPKENITAQPTEPGNQKIVGDLSRFQPNPVSNGSNASYNIRLKMDPSGTFVFHAGIQITNQSDDTWDKLVFYFLPNMFTVENIPDLIKEPGTVKIKQVKVNQKKTAYQLRGDELSIPLATGLTSGQNSDVEVEYEFTIPKKGIRFSQDQGNYYLAQWYPMLATYHNGWNKEPYLPLGESYHTAHSNFHIVYNIPAGYRWISSANEIPDAGKLNGEFHIEKVKEVYIAIVKDMNMVSTVVNNVEIRVFGRQKEKKLNEVLGLAEKAFRFFDRNVGDYPLQQLDILMNDELNMEYPGIVSIGKADNFESLYHVVAHEIAHQWFYGVVSNDPYHEGWIDEGLAELAVLLFFQQLGLRDQPNAPAILDEVAQWKYQLTMPSNLPLDRYQGVGITRYFYAQPVLKLWELLSKYDVEVRTKFLRDIYQTYAYQQLDTKEFVRFTGKYFNIDDSFFSDWLILEEES